MAATSSQETVSLCFLSTSGKQFKWYSSREGLLKLQHDEFDFMKWLLTKQDNKMVVIKGSTCNVTVKWYKSTKNVQVQGSNQQMVKPHFEQLILKANHNSSQNNIEANGSVARVKGDLKQVEF